MAVDFVSAEAARAVLDWPAMIDALRRAYQVPHVGQTSFRAVARGEGVWLRSLVSVPPGSRYMGVKSFGRTQMRQVTYLVSLFDQVTSELVAIIDGKHLTAMRTAATSAVAVDTLSGPGPLSLGILGSGTEASAHAEAMAAIRPLREIAVFSPTAAKRAALAERLSATLGIPVTAVTSAESAVHGADLVVAAARSNDETPILSGDWLADHALLVSIGSTIPEQRELDLRSIELSDLIVCDMLHEVTDETGDFLAARDAGLDLSGKMATLNQLMLGQLDDCVRAARRIMYKSVGAALQDVTVAALAYERARDRGLTRTIADSFEIQHV